jgi:hypothetical protein
MIKIKKKYFRFVLAFCVVLPVSAISSLCMRCWNHGCGGDLAHDWFVGFLKGFAIAYPCVVLFVWVGQKITNQFHWID